MMRRNQDTGVDVVVGWWCAEEQVGMKVAGCEARVWVSAGKLSLEAVMGMVTNCSVSFPYL